MDDDTTFDVQIKWPDVQLAALSYNLFYQDLWSVAFNDGVNTLDELNPNNNTSYTRTRGIGDYQDSGLYGTVNTYLTGLSGAGVTNSPDSSMQIGMKMAWDAPAISNGYQKYPMTFYCALTLEQTDKEVPDEPSVPTDPTPVYPIIPSDPTPIEPTPVDPAPVDPTPTEPTTPITDDPTPTTPTPDEPDTDVSDDKTPTTDVSDNKTPSSSAPKTGDRAELPGEILLLGFSVMGLTVILKNSKRR